MIDYDGREVGHAKGLQRQFGLLYELSRNDRGRWDAQLFESDRITAAKLMFALSAADAPRRSLFAFHFELSRMPRRKPSSFILRGAFGVTVWSTVPRGSNTCTELLSWCIACSTCIRQSLHMPSAQWPSDTGRASTMGCSTGVLMCPHPGINAENRPAWPPMTNR